MARLNGIYVFVKSEEVSYGVEATSHPVESGIDITDHVRRKARTITIDGEIVGKDANTVRSTLIALHQKGALCKYVGRTSLSNCIIEDFKTAHPHTIWGGCEFSMTLREIRTANGAIKVTTTATAKKTVKKSGTQQVKKKSKSKNVYHKVKKGDCVWNLVAASKAPYRSLSRPAINGKKYSACNWVMKKNPKAFSRKGDFGTLKIGYKLLVGQRK